ncbi:RidA family protein [Pseudomonas gingeri]|uniref:RidA family protein n=1 Tax=Pseudomonas gingeri TaxID=117681 RepID=A0A7Y7XBB8_9PSED|nr:RidA family protein [Pseudomonas gingeri]NWA24625.1 RidA family protein [Pseudomonas gingeri]NWB96758.1 RidA family protein [Pseudomonas gingeri]NWD67242.1 RidA family protein [Pseudomonas gingeri]NWD77924.1 RidA family protein [Pseudomonas gingeri]
MVHANLERKNYDALPAAVGPYSHAVKSGNMLYLSGFTAFGTAAQGKSMAEQAEAIFTQIKAVAEAEGIGMRSLVKVTTFVTDFSEIKELRPVLLRNYDGLPASSLVEVSKLFSPELNIEIEAIFAL